MFNILLINIHRISLIVSDISSADIGTQTLTRAPQLSDVLSWVGLVLNVISIVVTVIVYRISKATSQKLFEDSVARAIAKAKTLPDVIEHDNPNILLKNKQKRAIIRRLKAYFKRHKLSNAIEFTLLIKNMISEEQFIALLESWRANYLIEWTGNLENTTMIHIKNEKGIYESINSCKS